MLSTLFSCVLSKDASVNTEVLMVCKDLSQGRAAPPYFPCEPCRRASGSEPINWDVALCGGNGEATKPFAVDAQQG